MKAIGPDARAEEDQAPEELAEDPPYLPLRKIAVVRGEERQELERTLTASRQLKRCVTVSTAAAVEAQQGRIDRSIDQLCAGQDPTWRSRVKYIAMELLQNAARDAHQNQPEKIVEIIYGLADGHFILHVADEGSGFHPKTIPNPVLLENILKESGRGIMIVDGFLETLGGAAAYYAENDDPAACNRVLVIIPVPGAEISGQEGA